MKINNTILTLTTVVLVFVLINAVGAHRSLANVELHMKKSSTTCDGDNCHTVVCINNNCQSSNSTASKIIQNSTSP
ncbi:MAG: hypothetical protein WCF23_00020 [Candidatus Nitrosopolaris sp.]